MRNFYLVLILLIQSLGLNAQTITGTVTDSENNEGIPGANIVIKGSFTGTITNIDGTYTIEAQQGDTLLFSCIGYTSTSVVVRTEAVYDIQLTPDFLSLEEVVVTALGIKREEKALGYSTQKVDGDDISNSNELDVVNAISGKVSGVQITQGSGNVGGGGSRIVIRGETSLAGNNEPLYIIDGIPGGSNDVAPNDIETLQVLKGPAATALYGSKAGGGVVMITTKSGKGVEGTQIEVNSSFTWQDPLVLPEYQNTFGQGKSGQYWYYDGNNGGIEDDTELNWGPVFDGEPRAQFTGLKPWVAQPDNVSDFYETGHTYNNNVNISSSNEKGNYRFSYTNTRQTGIVPNTGLIKHRFDLLGSYKIYKRITLNANIKFNKTDSENQKSDNDPRYLPRNVDTDALKDYWVPGMEGQQQYSWRASSDNPYFRAYEQLEGYRNNQTLVNLSLNYDITDELSFMARYGGNFTNNNNFKEHAYKSVSEEYPGMYEEQRTGENKRNADFLFGYNKDITRDLNVNLSFGGSHHRKEYHELKTKIEGLLYQDIFNIQNRMRHPVEALSVVKKLERNSLYGFANFGYKNMLYLDITGRQDWSSTMHPDNNTFFYPSVAASAVMTEIFELPKSIITFWKIRGSWADVGNDFPTEYFTAPNKYEWKIDNETGEAYLVESKTKTDDGIKPERTRGWEIGTDLRLIDNRIGFDFTYYASISYDQILGFETSDASRYSKRIINAGEIENNGIEIMLRATPVRTNDFTWDALINFSRDRAVINSLIDSLPHVNKTQEVTSHLFIYDNIGQRRGTFYGKGFERNDNGDILYSLSGDTRRGDIKALGNYNPDWMLSFSNTFTYKSLSLYALLDYRHGGVVYNEVKRKLNMNGLSKETEYNNRVGIVPDGYVEDGSGGYRKLTLEDLENAGKLGGMSGEEYWANMMDAEIPESVIEDATYLKLREVRITYQLPAKWLDNIFIKSASISAVGRNLYVWSKVSHIDPELYNDAKDNNDFELTTKVPGYAKNDGIPSVRSYGFMFNVRF